MKHWQTGRFRLNCSTSMIMGIVNITPDSFSDGGKFFSSQSALHHAERLVREGVGILDIGAESSRPGAQPVSQDEELKRLLPVVQELVKWGIPISVDTYRPEVMQIVLDMGVDIINDICALRWRASSTSITADSVISSHPHCGICLMHMHQEPTTMQAVPMSNHYFLETVGNFLQERVGFLQGCGISLDRICIDPGIGFGKTLAQNFVLLREFGHLRTQYGLDRMVSLLGLSRKSSLQSVAQEYVPAGDTPNAEDLLIASTSAALLAVDHGCAEIVRVHDVRQTKIAMAILSATKNKQI